MARQIGFYLVVLVGFFAGRCVADDVFEMPVRLEADGKVIDTGRTTGHSGPTIADVDGDGLADLVVGSFGGKFQVYKNIGTPGEPLYSYIGFLQAGGTDASVRIYCCVGSQARFADLNGDGLEDFVSNSYDPGHCYFFRGLVDHQFAAPEELVDKAGVPVRSAPVQQQDYQSFGSFYTPVDWDGDGDFDLLIGCFDGHLKLRRNEGNAREPVFAADNETIDAGGKPLKVQAHCSPVVADWDGDGAWDILSGNEDGSVTWFRNEGTKQSPRLEKGVALVEPNATLWRGQRVIHWSEDDIVPGVRTQIEVIDHNGDGKLDLLVGDLSTALEVKPNLTDDERQALKQLVAEAEANGKARSEQMLALREEFAKRYPGDAILSDEANDEWSKAYQAMRNSPESKVREQREAALVRQMRPMLAEIRGSGDRMFDLMTNHGYVWLFVRK